MKALSKVFLLFCSAIVLFSNCKKDDTVPGNQGPTTTPGVDTYGITYWDNGVAHRYGVKQPSAKVRIHGDLFSGQFLFLSVAGPGQ